MLYLLVESWSLHERVTGEPDTAVVDWGDSLIRDAEAEEVTARLTVSSRRSDRPRLAMSALSSGSVTTERRGARRLNIVYAAVQCCTLMYSTAGTAGGVKSGENIGY